MLDKIFPRISPLILLLLGLWLLFDLASHLTAEILWRSEVGYLPEFWLRLRTQLGLWVLAFCTSSGFLLGNLALASRLKNLTPNPSGLAKRGTDLATPHGRRGGVTPPLHSGLRLRFLLPVVLGLSVLAGLILIYYGQKTLNFWHPNVKLPSTSLHLAPWVHQVSIPMGQLGLLLGLVIAIFINPQFSLRAIALLISLLLSFLLSRRWVMVLQYFHAISFNRTEPLFNQDISFYVFSLPIWEMLEFWLLGLFLYSMVAVALIYLQAANSLSEGLFAGFSLPQRLHLHILASLLMLVIALHYWIAHYQLLYSIDGVNYGASYTAANVQLPIYIGLNVLAVAIAIYLLLRMIILSKAVKASSKLVPYPHHLVYVLGLYLAVAMVGGEILPIAVQRLIVQPNELVRERPYIERTITLTRQAFNLNQIEAQTFDPQGQLTASDLLANNLTIRNIRLWDKRPLLETNRQLQQIRPYYKFSDADIDRYTLRKEGGRGGGRSLG